MKSIIIFLCILLIALTACNDDTTSTEVSGKGQNYVLAFSWQPAFCETAPRKRECKTQTKKRFDATHFTLHGLWPQPGSNIYCGVSDAEIALDKKGRWRQLDVERISQSLWDQLKIVMPGTMSSLHKHEWVKHGTCYDKSIEKYYEDSLWLMEKINTSKLQSFFQNNIGNEVSGDEIRPEFEKSFGAGSGDRIRISCKRDQNSNRQIITEITLGLSGKIGSDGDINTLILASSKTDPGCPKGIIDPVGFQ